MFFTKFNFVCISFSLLQKNKARLILLEQDLNFSQKSILSNFHQPNKAYFRSSKTQT